MMKSIDAAAVLPEDAARATLVARVHDREAGGPCVVAIHGDEAIDLTPLAPTMSDLLEDDDPAAVVRAATGPGPPDVRAATGAGPPDVREAAGHRWSLRRLLDDTLARRRDRPYLLAPCDLQVIKAAGVTFVRSMLERVIEERAGGDPARQAELRARLRERIGGAIGDVRPGSAEAAAAKQALIAEGLWSQYLEVGIGPDAEIFTKAPVLSSVGLGAEIGVLRGSRWNNPEPELVLAVDSRGRAAGATLGNDVNLRDIEGRSALLLGRAKDNNASCAIGPFIRLFDEGFGIDDVRTTEIALSVEGADGFTLTGRSSMREISRDPLELVGHALGEHHRYPDGIMLFTGTLFAPTEDRDVPGEGFTHRLGDVVTISAPRLGTLVNVVAHAEDAPPWTYGIRALMRDLAARGIPARRSVP